MMFNPQKYAIPDRRMQPFIDPDEIRACLQNARPDARAVRDTIARSLSRERLSMQETALLLNAEDPELIEEIKECPATQTRNLPIESYCLLLCTSAINV